MAMHLLAIELNLGRHLLELLVENSAAKRRIRATMQSEVWIKDRECTYFSTGSRGKNKEDVNTSNNCAGSSD
jgi:hypothetical protein